MTVWLQQHDLSSEDLTDPSMESVLSLLQSFDWQTEIQKEKEERESGRVDCCPAGIGMIHDEGQILHIIPTNGADFICHYHFPVKQRKFLGVFGKSIRRQTLSFKDVEKKVLLSTIRAHYQGNHGQVMNRLAQTATRI